MARRHPGVVAVGAPLRGHRQVVLWDHRLQAHGHRIVPAEKTIVDPPKECNLGSVFIYKST